MRQVRDLRSAHLPLLLCLLVWKDFFPAPELDAFRPRSGQDSSTFVEVRVEHCAHLSGRRIVVYKRYYREFYEGQELKQEVLLDWKPVLLPNPTTAIISFPLGEKP